ncbi:MAG: hypothetical protein ACP5GI_00325 [Sulfolobales archaeon]
MQSKSVLIVGLLPHESGKTFLASSLAEELRLRGINIGVSKPIAGHSLWYQWSTYIDSIKEGVLVGFDAMVLKKKSVSKDPLEMINPIDLATIPPDFVYRDSRDIEFLYSEYLSARSIDITAVGRVSLCKEKSDVETKHYIIRDHIEKLNESNKEYIYKLAEKLSPKPLEIFKREFLRILQDSYVYVDNCLDHIVKTHMLTIIESFNDSAAPTIRSLDSDLTLIVLPGRVYVYEGSRYKMAFEVISDVSKKLSNPLENWVSTRELIRLLRNSYLYTLEIPHSMEETKYKEKISILTDRITRLLEKI